VDGAGKLRQLVDSNPVWYHTIELAPGVTTPGHVDLRRTAARHLPRRLDGVRALDAGAFDGFWTFELERRGAEVVAIDVERASDAQWPELNRPQLEAESAEWGLRLGDGFAIAAEALGSRARRVICDVLELTPEAIGGPVGFAFCGSLLVHLRDPVLALERITATLEPGGRLTVMEPISPALTVRSPRRPAARFQPLETPFNWWLPNLAALRAWLHSAGLDPLGLPRLARPPARKEMRQWYAVLDARRPPA